MTLETFRGCGNSAYDEVLSVDIVLDSYVFKEPFHPIQQSGYHKLYT